jgi:uroporphyrinogen-III decarboxylase
MSLFLLEFGSKEQVVDRMKYLIDNCAAGGGYIFQVAAGMEKANYENVAAMFETAHTYGKK